MKQNIAYIMLTNARRLALKRDKTIESIDISEQVFNKFMQKLEELEITLPEGDSFTFEDVTFNKVPDCPPLHFNVNYAE